MSCLRIFDYGGFRAVLIQDGGYGLCRILVSFSNRTLWKSDWFESALKNKSSDFNKNFIIEVFKKRCVDLKNICDTPLKHLPLYINDPDECIQVVAKKRLETG